MTARTRRLLASVLGGVSILCPVLAIAALVWAFVSNAGFVGFLARFALFWILGFAGLAARGLAQQLAGRRA